MGNETFYWDGPGLVHMTDLVNVEICSTHHSRKKGKKKKNFPKYILYAAILLFESFELPSPGELSPPGWRPNNWMWYRRAPQLSSFPRACTQAQRIPPTRKTPLWEPEQETRSRGESHRPPDRPPSTFSARRLTLEAERKSACWRL